MRSQQPSKTDLNTGNEERDAAVAALRAGEVVLFPTDTVYGIGLAVGISKTLEALYAIKERARENPIPWLVENPHALDRYTKDLSTISQRLAQEFWPGPLTLIVEANDRVERAFCAVDGSIALRMPNNTTALELIKGVGQPLATTSANISGQEPPREFRDIDPRILSKVSIALADSQQRTGLASTIVDCRQENPRVLREGSITRQAILALS